MADERRMSAEQLVGKLLSEEHADLLREGVAWLCHQLMEAEVAAQIGAGLHERSGERAAYRCSYVKAVGSGQAVEECRSSAIARMTRKTTLARWRLRQRSASRRLWPPASLRARYSRAGPCRRP